MKTRVGAWPLPCPTLCSTIPQLGGILCFDLFHYYQIPLLLEVFLCYHLSCYLPPSSLSPLSSALRYLHISDEEALEWLLIAIYILPNDFIIQNYEPKVTLWQINAAESFRGAFCINHKPRIWYEEQLWSPSWLYLLWINHHAAPK